jgi:hypothetical protein
MDIPVTLLAVTLVYGIVKWLNELINIPSQLKIPLAVVISIGSLFLMQSTDWSAQQEFFGRNLDNMNNGSVIVAAIILAFGAVGLDTVFKTVRNVGENDPTT